MSLCSAAVLHAYDVGETDRLCILLTQSYGKIAARANGVRQCKSRMGGVLLPLHHVTVSLQETRSGWTICDARLLHACRHDQPVLLQQGIEMLILLLEDDEPVPDIFALTKEFFGMCPTTLVPFTIKLLHMMGVLPTDHDSEYFKKLSPQGQDFVRCCTQHESLQNLEKRFPDGDSSLVSFCESILNTQLPRPLRSRIVASAIGS